MYRVFYFNIQFTNAKWVPELFHCFNFESKWIHQQLKIITHHVGSRPFFCSAGTLGIEVRIYRAPGFTFFSCLGGVCAGTKKTEVAAWFGEDI
jgi:hypothetical protein